MKPVAFDFETALIRPAYLAPAPACMTWQAEGEAPSICAAADAEPRLKAWLEDPDVLLIGANVAFDFAVVAEAWPHLRPLIFQAYEHDRVTDVQIRDRLLNIAGGVYLGRFGKGGVYVKHRYDLAELAKRRAGIELRKDEWRLSYGEFIGVPLDRWVEHAPTVQERARHTLADLEAEWADVKPSDVPKDVRGRIDGLREMIASDPRRVLEYPLEDALATLAVWKAQEPHAAYLADQYRKARAYWGLYLGSAWGIRTDPIGVEILRRETEAAYNDTRTELVEAGLVRSNGVADTKAAKRLMIEVCRTQGLELRRTDGHENPGKCKRLDNTPVPDGADECEDHVCLDAEACEATDHPLLLSYAEFSTLRKVLTNDVNSLEGGTEYPIHTRYGLAGSGRTTSSKQELLKQWSMNIQNLRRREGIREAFVPRPGHVFVGCDYPQLESYTWAEFCMARLGFSRLAEVLNAGLDNHLMLTASMIKSSYDDVALRYSQGDPEIDDLRQLSKVGNYGFPGGMFPPTMLASAKKQLKREVVQRLGLDLERMEQLREDWLHTWPEAQPYFDYIRGLGPPAPKRYSATVESLYTQRFRGDVTYCAACNNGFQALGADCATHAVWLVSKAMYAEPESPLYDARMVAFVHDELLNEVREDRVDPAANALADLMTEGANFFLKNVPIPRAKMKPVAMRRWSKKAKPVYEAGRLVPWEGVRDAA